ncbi:hypothetical protein K503DRAFT_333836 [Rhizopogon vinicolor AM-OR11-026]|uniref:Uncharacterized protein n=1 Tax=Rhizopogon vinicolor AM-OR11-026 TaxID=1314800 RepID=A0A1B7NCP0_9AGAM|nr:hypothetical protein K503DRAFT_333836 [Rhizopogon vinicolor AM-OR11-026]
MCPASIAASSALKAKMNAIQNGDKTRVGTQGSAKKMKEEPMLIPNQEHRQDQGRDPREGRRYSFTIDSSDEDCHDNTIEFLRRSKQRHSSLDGPRPYLTVSGDDLQGPGPRVRFHSRVRITAGMRGRRRPSDGQLSAASSISGSPCSSISAPLRSANAASSKGWGPLGQRVSILASQSYASEPSLPTGRRKIRPKVIPSESCHTSPVNEHTPLVRSPCRYSYARGYYEDDMVDEVAEREHEHQQRMIDETFGKWPGRLLNRHWWWWQVEPLVCCLCVDCTDVEE